MPSDPDTVAGGDHRDPVSSLSCEQFELLSAYLDDEVTDPERTLVEGWLATDPMIRQAFQNLGGLSRSISQVPVPQAATVEQTVRAVMARIDRRHRRIHWLGGSAIAAAVTAVIASVSTGQHDLGWQLASNRPAPESSTALSSESPEAASPSSVKAAKSVAVERSVVERALIVE
ncbi:MAG: zf-HC2 domain-containing protein [Oscillatoriales cyanobacterium]|nr:MAG: zf-HC2 domain-containing protein [Oscillatoriales cyanobacterium]